MQQTLKLLKANKNNLTRQQYKTLRGQVLAGDTEGALKGLRKICDRTQHNIVK